MRTLPKVCRPWEFPEHLKNELCMLMWYEKYGISLVEMIL